MLISLLDLRTKCDFENSIETSKQYPTYSQLQNFLLVRSFKVKDGVDLFNEGVTLCKNMSNVLIQLS